ncbi:unnamed protein product [[Actinomadura] parvosata subsp. kistnae]|nr:unnamed protein product [Actinomadura parvosata subsp. kistnae]
MGHVPAGGRDAADRGHGSDTQTSSQIGQYRGNLNTLERGHRPRRLHRRGARIVVGRGRTHSPARHARQRRPTRRGQRARPGRCAPRGRCTGQWRRARRGRRTGHARRACQRRRAR